MSDDNKIGDYLIVKALGGYLQCAKLGEHIRTGKQVVIRIHKVKYDHDVKDIKREIAILKLLNHPNILKLHDVIYKKNCYYIVQERLDGNELFDYICRKEKLNRSETLVIMSHVIKALEFVHMNNICHRNIKLDNIIVLDENKNVKLIDFADAEFIAEEEKSQTCGSPKYSAPEVISNVKCDGRISDIWSLGVVFYACITGMLPFDQTDTRTLVQMIKCGKYEIPSFVDDDICDLLKLMLTTDLNKRIATNEIRNHRVWSNENGENIYFKDPINVRTGETTGEN